MHESFRNLNLKILRVSSEMKFQKKKLNALAKLGILLK